MTSLLRQDSSPDLDQHHGSGKYPASEMRPLLVMRLFVLIGTVALVLLVHRYHSVFGSWFPEKNREAWGQLGDFFGGTLNPIFSFLSLIALLITIHLQSLELQATRAELIETRKAAQKQADASQQQFELAQKEADRRIAAQFIDEFFSRNFIAHRSSLWKTRLKVIDRKVTLYHIAKGFIYPIENEDYYVGDNVDGLPEHQHLTIYLGFIERINQAIAKSDAVKDALRCAFSYEFKWHADLLYELAECTKKLVETNEQPQPSYVQSIKTVLDAVGITQTNSAFQVAEIHHGIPGKRAA